MTKMAELKCRLPQIDTLETSPLVGECASLNQFLSHCVPHSLQELYFNNYPCVPSSPCDSYCSELGSAVSGTTKIVFLKELVMSEDTFTSIFKAASQAEELVLSSCKIEASKNLDLSGPKYR